MESNFNNRDFEQFVKQNADQYRMFPSEKVWKGIHNTLHTRRRWYGVGFVLLLLTTGTVTWMMMSSTDKNQLVSPNPAIIHQNNIDIDNKIQKRDVIIESRDKTNINPVAENNLKDISNRIFKNESEKIDQTAVNYVSPVLSANTTVFDKQTNYQLPSQLGFIGTINDNNLSAELNNLTENTTAENKDIYPLSIESVVNSFEIVNRKKWLWQIYFTPTISYRRLSENKAFLSSTQPNGPYNYTAVYDVNAAVTHKPDMGFELGFSTGYAISKNLKIIGGLQFNVSKYDIRAYTYPTELATIALTSSSNGSRSVYAPTNYRNFDGYRTNWLHNLYLSASAPIGVELKLKGDNKTYLGIAGSIQPTYILGDRAYMISTDYKNYAEVPQLIRRWNVSGNFETFAAYSTGKINWKIGPQVRYQMLSSFQQKYPVKEHIFDFGLKVGIMLNQ